MNAVFKVYDALKRNGMDDNDARLLSESIGEGHRGERFDQIEHLLAEHGKRFDEIEHTLAKHGERLGDIETRLAKVETKLDTGFMFIRWMLAFQGAAIIAIVVKIYL